MLSSTIYAYRLVFVLLISFHIFFLYAADNPTLEYHSNKSSNNQPTSIYPKKKLPLLEEKSPTPQHFSKLVNKNTILNLNIASYFLNILASPDESTWSTTGGPINKTIKHIGLTIHHQETVERTWHMVNKFKEMEQEYTGNNNVTRNLNPSYLLSNLDEINILAYSMGNRLGLRYTTKLLNFHLRQNCFDAVFRSTVNLAFLRLQPKIKRIQRIQQDTKNEGKWKEARQRQTKQWLIMINRLPEDKE